MSVLETDGQFSGGETEASDPTVGGPVEEAGEEAPVIPVDEFADHLVTVKVDGEELRVPLREALNGYQRHADYTRKTQQIAEQAREYEFARVLHQALQADPAATIEVLRSTYGVNTVSEPEAGVVAGSGGAEQADAGRTVLDPVEERLARIEATFQQLEKERAYNELVSELNVLKQRYGDDFDPNEVVLHAYRSGRTDIENVYKEIAFDKLMARRQGVDDFVAAGQQRDAERVAAKEDAAAVVSSGVSAAGGTVPRSEPNSLAEAWELAKQALGVNFDS